MRRPVLLAAVVTLALVGCGKKAAKNNTPDSSPPPDAAGGSGGGGGGSNSGGITAAGGVGIVFNPAAALGGGGSGGAAQAVRKAVVRVKDGLNQMNTLGQLIEQMRDPTGRMPTKDQIVAQLKQYPKLLEAVNEGSFILTGTTEGGGLWAYEVDADKTPGIALIGGRATRSTPDELRPYFAQLPQPPAQPPARPPAQPQQQPRPGTSSAAPATGAAVTKQDMEDIRLFIDTASQASGRMPDVQTVYNALVQSQSPAAKLLASRAVLLTGTQTRESVWAYEAKAVTQGGMIAGPNGVETVTAAELQRHAGQR